MPKSGILQINLLCSAMDNNFTFGPLEDKECVFSHLNSLVARVLDFTLRSDGESDNFKWKFKEYIR